MLALRFSLLVVFVLAFSGCGMDANQVAAPALPSGSPVVQAYSQTSGTIGSGGGSLSTGGVTLTLPPQALSLPTTVGLAVTESGGTYMIEVTPNGQQLAAYATVVAPCQSGGCEVWCLDPSTQSWKNVTTSTSPGYVQGRALVLGRFDVDELD